MIQRIQTIWLLLAAAAASLAFFVPFGTQFVSELNTTLVEGQAMDAWSNKIVAILVFNIILCCLIAIFAFKKRSVQMLFSLMALFHSALCVGIMFFEALFQNDNTTIHFGIIAPVLAFVFALLAFRGVRKDDKLVKNLDRLR